MKIRNIFYRKHKEPDEPQTVEGAERVPMTAEPDNAELAAQALLEVMIERKATKRKTKKASKKKAVKKSGSHGSSEVQSNGKTEAESNADTKTENPADLQTVEHYHQLAERIRLAYASSRQRTMRFLSFCEQELQRRDIPAYGKGSIALLEAELYKRIDIVEREGGELKKRWQNCLAEVTLRLMEANAKQKAENEKRYELEYNEQHNQQA